MVRTQDLALDILLALGPWGRTASKLLHFPAGSQRE